MPRSLQEIIDNADALATAAEHYEPTDDQLAYAGELAGVYRSVRQLSEAETNLVEAITAARAAGAPWREIGTLVGTTGEAARQRYGQLIP